MIRFFVVKSRGDARTQDLPDFIFVRFLFYLLTPGYVEGERDVVSVDIFICTSGDVSLMICDPGSKHRKLLTLIAHVNDSGKGAHTEDR
jgi:hypothetical protein